jgi:hypothetical protein
MPDTGKELLREMTGRCPGPVREQGPRSMHPTTWNEEHA